MHMESLPKDLSKLACYNRRQQKDLFKISLCLLSRGNYAQLLREHPLWSSQHLCWGGSYPALSMLSKQIKKPCFQKIILHSLTPSLLNTEGGESRALDNFSSVEHNRDQEFDISLGASPLHLPLPADLLLTDARLSPASQCLPDLNIVTWMTSDSRHRIPSSLLVIATEKLYPSPLI